MKTKILTIAAILMLAINISYAKSPQSDLRQTITEKVKFPSNALEQKIEGTVYVEFKVTPEGKIEVLNCFSLQGELQTYIFQTISGISVSPDPELLGITFVMRFDFNLI